MELRDSCTFNVLSAGLENQLWKKINMKIGMIRAGKIL
jgi:hypothetical protein